MKITQSITSFGKWSGFLLLFLSVCTAYAQIDKLDKELSILTPGAKISASLKEPKTRSPLVIFVAGSGPTDRNGNGPGLNTNCYQMLASELAKKGIASLRYDKRLIGKSTADSNREEDVDFDDFVSDLVAIKEFAQRDLLYEQIFFLGHSEGSLISLIAAQKTRVAGVISLAGPGRPFDVVLLEQLKKQSQSIYASSAAVFDDLRAGKTPSIPDDPILKSLFRESILPFLRNVIQYNPAQLAASLDVPLLIVQGSRDLQVTLEDAKALDAAQPAAQLLILENMTHVLKNSDSNQRIDQTNTVYRDSSLPINKKLAPAIASFIKKGPLGK